MKTWPPGWGSGVGPPGWVLGFRGSWVQGFRGFRALGVQGFRVWGLRFRVQGLPCKPFKPETQHPINPTHARNPEPKIPRPRAMEVEVEGWGFRDVGFGV